MAVLKIDMEVARFVKDRTVSSIAFDGTSFHRLIAHKARAYTRPLFSSTRALCMG
jgi:hypothetical protein